MLPTAMRTGKLERVSRCAVIEGTILQPPKSVPSCEPSLRHPGIQFCAFVLLGEPYRRIRHSAMQGAIVLWALHASFNTSLALPSPLPVASSVLGPVERAQRRGQAGGVDRVGRILTRHWRAVVASVLVAVVGVALPLVLLSEGSSPHSIQIHDIQVGQPESGETAFTCTPGPCSKSAIARLRAGLLREVTFIVTTSGPASKPTCAVAIRGHGRPLGRAAAFLASFGTDSFAWMGTALFSHTLSGVVASNVRVACSV